MNAERVHGGGELFASMSERFGRLGQYGPVVVKPLVRGMATLSGREGTKSVMSSSDFSSRSSDFESDLVSHESWVSVGDDVREEGTVFTLRTGFAVFLMLMLFQMPPDGRRAWRSFCRSSLCLAGCERRSRKARLAGGRQDRHEMVTVGEW
jgi:hypothetical protein